MERSVLRTVSAVARGHGHPGRYELGPEELKGVPSVPGSLDAALIALENDHEFLLKGDVFTQDAIDTWIDYKRKREVDPVRMRPHPYEFTLYYDI